MFGDIYRGGIRDTVTGGTLVAVALISYVIYFSCLGIYRVYFSPLRRFPGPKLAAFTTLYQAYYDICLQGQYFKKIQQLHATYGPIVRINPHELHVNDPSFIDELYAGSAKKRDKYKWSGRTTLLPDSLVATRPNDLHRRRRAAINPFFSKARIRQLDQAMRENVEGLLRRLDESASTNKPFPIGLAYKAATCDIITKICFGDSTNYLTKDDLERPYFEAVDSHLKNSWFMAYIPGAGKALDSVPPSIMGWIYPGLKSLWVMHERWTQQIKSIRSADKSANDGSIFHSLIHGDIPPFEKSTWRLRQEAQLLVLAGQDTTAYTLTAITFQLLSNPEILAKLQTELQTALPNRDSPLDSARLEQLPYLTGIIQEGIRLHPGVIFRQTRVAPTEDLIFREENAIKEWVIPAGTPVSMDALSCNRNAQAFPNPTAFIPDRWISNPRLDRFMLSFSKGTRNCLGMNLAYSELYMILAGVFRRYESYDGSGTQTSPTLSLHDTIRQRDVDVTSDFMVPFPTKGSKGVQIKVRAGIN